MIEKLRLVAELWRSATGAVTNANVPGVTRPRVRKALIAGTAVGGIILLWGITDNDVSAYNAYRQGAQAVPLSAGDIVTINADGDYEPLCQPSFSEAAYIREDRAGLYFNRLEQAWGLLLTGMAQIKLISDDKAKGYVAQSRIAFVGKTSSLRPEAVEEYRDLATCPCQVAQAVARGETVCQINASLTETNQVEMGATGELQIRPSSTTWAINVRQTPFVPPTDGYWPEHCEVPTKRTSTPATSCTNYHRLPFDVRMRNTFNLIGRQDLPQEVAGLQ